MWRSLRSGSWLNEQRLRIYPMIFLGLAALAVAALIATAHGRLDASGRPLGTDFSQVWVAGLETLRGHPDQPFDVARHISEQHAQFGEKSDVYGWHYPPFFLAPAALLALLPYLEALAVWQIGTLTLYLAAIVCILRSSGLDLLRVIVAALAFPAVLINLAHGQNGFLTAALLGFGFAALEKRPSLAGLCLGLLAYKPQFAVVLPIALIAGRQWRAFLAAAATIAAMTLASVIAFGPQSWAAFFNSLAFTREIVIEQGATGFPKIQSVFAAVRLLGGDVELAYAVQAGGGLLVVGALALLWRSQADGRLKSAATITATLLTTPYCLDYDMVALGPAIAFLVAHGEDRGFGPFEKSVLAAVFVAPLLARPVAALLSLPLGVLTTTLLFALTISSARRVNGFRLFEPSPGSDFVYEIASKTRRFPNADSPDQKKSFETRTGDETS